MRFSAEPAEATYIMLVLASLGALSPSQLDELALKHCNGRVFLDGGSNTGDSVRAFLSGA